MISGCYATFIGSNRSLVRSPLAGYLGGSVARYVKVKEAEKSLMSAQNSSFEVRRRGGVGMRLRRFGSHNGLYMLHSELNWSGEVGPDQGAAEGTLGCHAERGSGLWLSLPRSSHPGACARWHRRRHQTDAEAG